MASALAQRVATGRKARGLSMDSLAQRAGVSKGTLVQIEQGRGNPAIATLCRLAAALDLSVADLVAPPEATQPVTILRPPAQRRLWTGPQGGSALLLAGTTGPDMLEIWHWVLMPGERFTSEGHGHGTRELLHVTEGTLSLEIAGTRHVLTAGDSAVAQTDRPHAYANTGTAPSRFTMTVHEPPKGP
jgi:transcriptional regulator with XRE-family HTH domain